MAGSAAATCDGSFNCDIGRYLGVYPGTSISTGNFAVFADLITSMVEACAAAGLAAWQAGTALEIEEGTMLANAKIGSVTFTPGVYIHESSINVVALN
jgi:hypothetical protein